MAKVIEGSQQQGIAAEVGRSIVVLVVSASSVAATLAALTLATRALGW